MIPPGPDQDREPVAPGQPGAPGGPGAAASGERWTLTLYVNGASPNSVRAIESVRQMCDAELCGEVDLEIIDVKQHPTLVVRDQIVAAPTLVRRMPAPLRRIVGDLSDTARVRIGLDLRAAPAGERPERPGPADPPPGQDR